MRMVGLITVIIISSSRRTGITTEGDRTSRSVLDNTRVMVTDIVWNVVAMVMIIRYSTNSTSIMMMISCSIIIVSRSNGIIIIMIVISSKSIINHIRSCSCLNSHTVIISGCIITVVVTIDNIIASIGINVVITIWGSNIGGMCSGCSTVSVIVYDRDGSSSMMVVKRE